MSFSSFRLAFGPSNLLGEKRDGGDSHFGATFLNLPGEGYIHESVVLLVVDAADCQRFEYQALPLAEDLVPVFIGFDLTYDNRAGLPAGDGRVGRVLEPVTFAQAIDQAAAEVGHVAGDALYLRVGNRLHDDIVARPVRP